MNWMRKKYQNLKKTLTEKNFETTELKPKNFPTMIILRSRRDFQILDSSHYSFSTGEKVKRCCFSEEKTADLSRVEEKFFCRMKWVDSYSCLSSCCISRPVPPHSGWPSESSSFAGYVRAFLTLSGVNSSYSPLYLYQHYLMEWVKRRNIHFI